MNDMILAPLDYYKAQGAETHRRNAEAFFDRLLEQSGIDREVNRAAAQAYEEQEALCGSLKEQRFLYALGFAGAAALILSGSGCLCFLERSVWFLPAGLGLILLGICLMVLKLGPGWKTIGIRLSEAKEQAQQLLDRAKEQLLPLDRLFTPRDGLTLIEQTVPGLSFLPRFTVEHLARLKGCDFREHDDPAASVLRTLPGNCNGNPFLFTSTLSCVMVDETYEGSTTIHWEEEEQRQVARTRTVTDSFGEERTETCYEWETVTVQRSETLTATHTAPKPRYDIRSELGYGHHTAPELCFTRHPGHVQRLSEGRRQARIRSGERKLRRKEAQALRREEDFEVMVNEEFDVLFGAADRNDSRQFLRLFTPMAQKNLVALLTDPDLCGDEFSFRKDGRYNTVSCDGSVLEPSALHYHDYSVDKAREAFLAHQQDYFRSLFGCFAPLLSIPAYQERPLTSEAPALMKEGCFPRYEHEVMANGFAPELVDHPECRTRTIRKTQLLSSIDGVDTVRVCADGFTTRARTATYQVRGGDGYYHDVDVDWTEYIPQTNYVNIAIQAADRVPEGAEEPGMICLNGLTAKIINTTQEEIL